MNSQEKAANFSREGTKRRKLQKKTSWGVKK
jgi:hypothetical protein